MAKQKTVICRLCGRKFIPTTKGEKYCPGVCAMTADMIRPMQPAGRRRTPAAVHTDEPKAKPRPEEAAFPRVMAMFAAPIEERWKMARDFTEAEAEFSRKMQRRMLAEEKRLDYDATPCYCTSACTDDDEESQGKSPFEDDPLGDSDDGTV